MKAWKLETGKKYKIVCGLGSVLTTCAMSILLDMQTSNVLAAGILFLLYFFYRKQDSSQLKDLKKNQAPLLVSMILTLCMTVHGFKCFDQYESLTVMGKLSIILCIFLGFGILFYIFLSWLYGAVEHRSVYGVDIETSGKKANLVFFLAMAVMLLCWLPFYLKNYPAVIISDSMDQIGQAIRFEYSNHHPVVQTWILQIFMKIGNLWKGQLNTGIALYCIAQMVVLAAIYAYVIRLFYQRQVKRWIYIIATLYYALMPYHVMFSINIWKDTLFSASILLLTAILWKYTGAHAPEKENIADIVLLLLAGCCMTLFRNNGFYAFLVLLIFTFFLLRKSQPVLTSVMFGILAITILVKGPLFYVMEVEQPSFVESVSIPAQQIARVITDGAELTEEQQELLSQVVEIDSIPDTYNEHISDPIKNLISADDGDKYLSDHKMDYLKLWVQLGVNHPFQYLSAYIDQTEGYWYPDVQYWAYAEGICANTGGLVTESKLPKALDGITDGILWQGRENLPLYGLLWSIGGFVWLMFICGGYCVYRGRKKMLLIFLPTVILWGTLLVATPVYAEFRYLYVIFLSMPLYLVVACEETKVEDNGDLGC